MEDCSALARRQCAVRQDTPDVLQADLAKYITACTSSLAFGNKVDDSGVPCRLINVAVMYPAYSSLTRGACKLSHNKTASDMRSDRVDSNPRACRD